MKIKIFQQFGIRVTIAIVLSMLAVTALSAVMMYQLTFKSQFENLRTHLKTLARTTAANVSAQQVLQIPLSKEGANDPLYASLRDYIKKIKAVNPTVKSIYILRKLDASDVWQFVIDDDERGRYKATYLPGELYDAGRFSQMVNGYNEPSADKKIEVDEWGKTLSGYAPIRDFQGKPVAVLGVDIDAADIYMIRRAVIHQTLMVMTVSIMLSLFLGFLISRRVAGPVQRLISGARYIGEGNLHYQVDIRGNDEIAQLSKAFNEMASNLKLSHQQLLNYFLDAVKSMVKILEYRDHYTLGHSESVASYADQIALQMGIDVKTREMFHHVCLLHDIGKVGIRDSVLLKKDPLSEEEWRAVKIHPILGEQILKPILQDALMLSVIRNHHERFDGQGYPDGIKAEQIPLLVAIATVADSYDAMISNRSYREAMSHEEAVAQLVKHRGTQFNPDVVDAFLIVLDQKKPA